MTTVVIIGTGNVARHLFDAFRATDAVVVIQVLGRNPKALEYFKEGSDTSLITASIKKADMYIIAVSDDAIAPVSQLFNSVNGLVVHTSGNRAFNVLPEECRKGVFYPLQTFSQGRKIDFRQVPVCIETETREDLEYLEGVAKAISDHVYEMPFLSRRQLHLAAVFINNFGNHLFYIAHELLGENSLPFHLMLPLIRETAAKLEEMTPGEAQTGPARRGDTKTIEEQMLLLHDSTHRELYNLMSNAIQNTYAKDI